MPREKKRTPRATGNLNCTVSGMTARTRTVGLALAAALAFTSLPAGAQMYKWTDEAGSVTYSNTPPSEPAKVSDVTKIDDINTVPLDSRPKAPQAAAPSEAPAAAKPEAAPRAQASSRALQPEAVQDPCLRSADPHCYQRNKEKYHPYMGYTPAAAGAIGASSSPPGTGAVGGQVGPAPAAEKRTVPAATTAPAINVKTK